MWRPEGIALGGIFRSAISSFETVSHWPHQLDWPVSLKKLPVLVSSVLEFQAYVTVPVKFMWVLGVIFGFMVATSTLPIELFL